MDRGAPSLCDLIGPLTVMTLPLRGKQLTALRAIAATLGGLRITAYPSAMPLLMQMGLVEERAAPPASPTATAEHGSSPSKGGRR